MEKTEVMVANGEQLSFKYDDAQRDAIITELVRCVSAQADRIEEIEKLITSKAPDASAQ